MPEQIVLKGCTPEPLSNYLKALGVLRLVVEQNQDPLAKGYWHDNNFVLSSNLSQDDLVQFLLYDYQPTPLVAPWNGSTGFYPKDNKKTIESILNSQADRFSQYRHTIQVAQKQVETLKLTVQPKDKAEKKQLLTRLRNHLPDSAVKWLDTCTLITSEELKFPPLTGTGGNDGNFEFSRTFMQQLQELLDLETGKPKENATLLLHASIFHSTVPGLQFAGKIGQFNPIAAGGANAAPGYEAASRVNPWDYVLMLEGIMLFTSGATRRYEQSELGELAYPFTVRPSSIGYGSASENDETRAELWIPLWSAPTRLKELQILFSEGRAKVGARAAKDGVDFARAISSLGVERGLAEFVRYSFQVRNGLSYFAIPLGRFQPKFNPLVDRLAELDNWLLRFRRAQANANAPASVKRAARHLETTIVELTQGKANLLDVLMALGAVEKALSRSRGFTIDQKLRPLKLLPADWLTDCDDGTVEFRLAHALAGRGLRQRLVYVRGNDWLENDDGITTWQEGSLVRNLVLLLQREEIEQEQPGIEPKPPSSPFASLTDIARWIEEGTDDERLEAIARGLSLVRLSGQYSIPEGFKWRTPAAYNLLALVHRRVINEEVTLPRVPELLPRLLAGNCLTATSLASRRLYSSGLRPAVQGMYEPPARTLRIAAALAFPISKGSTASLLKQVQRFSDDTIEDS